MPDWSREIKKHLAGLNLSPNRETEIAEELAEHLEERYRELRSAGMASNEAYASAITELDKGGFLTGELRGIERAVDPEPPAFGGNGRAGILNSIWRDLRYGIRGMRRNPGFTAVAIITLALGIGANSAIFSAIDGLLLKALPYKDSDRLVVVWENRPARGEDQMNVSGHEFVAWNEQNNVFDRMAAFSYENLNLIGVGEPESLIAASVSDGFLSVLQANPEYGRDFLPEEDRPGAARVVLLSDKLWRSRFGADPSITGKPITLSDQSYTVVGVMPPGFQFPPPPPGYSAPDLWLPLARPLSQLAGLHDLAVIARLKSGVPLRQAQAGMDTIAQDLEQEAPETNKGHGVNVVPLSDQLVGKIRPALLILLAAVGLVLLIACANVASLLLGRATARQMEIAIRAALGADRVRIVSQMMTESMLLGVIGGAAGLLLATWIVALLRKLSPSDLAGVDRIAIGGRVLAVALGLSLISGIASGVLPAIRGARAGALELLAGQRATANSSQLRFRSALAVLQIAMALMLLIGAGLMLRSFVRLAAVDPGFSPANLITMQVGLPDARYHTAEARRRFFDSAFDQIRRTQGVVSVGATNALPLGGSEDSIAFSIAGRPEPAAGEEPTAGFRVVSPDYFRALNIPLLKGRFFEESDARVSVPLIRWFPAQPLPPRFTDPQPLPVVTINQAMAERYWPGENPIGQQIKVLFGPPITIVGEVGNVRHSGLDSGPKPELYLCSLQEPQGLMTVVVRTSKDASTLERSMQEAVWAVDRDQPIGRMETMSSVFSDSVSRQRFESVLLGAFGLIALLLAAVGIFGVMSQSVGQRVHEIGVRSALGATTRDIYRLVIGQGMALTVAGLLLGMGGALLLTRWMSVLLFGVSPTDALTFSVVPIVLGLVALAACYIPAHRAAQVDPMTAIRYE